MSLDNCSCPYKLYYCIHGTLGNNFNIVVWWFWLQLPNLMYTNTTYNHMYHIVQNFDRGNLTFLTLLSWPSKFTPSNCLQTVHTFTGVWWKMVTIRQKISVKYLKDQYPSKFPPVKILHYTVLWSSVDSTLPCLLN